MFKHLQMRNFKGWKDTGEIIMAPITLFFGANSSGKSSIGQFLMMLKQTTESPDRRAVLFTGDDKSIVQLGSFQQMVSDRDQKNKIYFEYKWECKNTVTFTDPNSKTKYSGKIMAFETEVALTEIDQSALRVEHLKYTLFDDDAPEAKMSISMHHRKTYKSYSEYAVESETYALTRKLGRAWPIRSPLQFYGFPETVVAYYQNADCVKELNFQQEILFRSLYYLGPLRSRTTRLYSWNGIEPDSVGYSGENTISALLAAKNRKIGIKKATMRRAYPAKPFTEIIAESLLTMGLIEKFDVIRLSENRHEYEVKVQIKGSNASVDLPDVGFGISQVLPVLVQCYYAPPDSIIIMEQPEIHLHPSAQSALADVLINVIQSRENNADRNIQLIIETHSEHFLRRLQRRIAEGAIPRDHVRAYFASVEPSSSLLTPLDIDPYGNIKNWPDHFFGDEMGDITAQAKATMETVIQERSRIKGGSHD